MRRQAHPLQAGKRSLKRSSGRASMAGTWPMRTELTGNLKKQINCSRVQHCPRLPPTPCRCSDSFPPRVPARTEPVLPEALDEMTKGSGDERSPVAPVDLSQAIIGPGMAVFSKYAAVLEADGTPMTVRDGASAHQSVPRRGRLRPRHAILSALVRAARLEGRQVRRCRYARPRQRHER